MTRITGRSRSPVPTDPAVSYADVPAGGWPRGWRMNRLLQSTFPPVLLSWLSSRFVNDQSLRPESFLAWDDVISCPWPQSASVRIRHDQTRSDPARRHAALGTVPAPEPARGMDHDPGGRLEFHVFAVLAVFTCEFTGYGPGKLWCPTCSPRRAAAEGSAQRSALLVTNGLVTSSRRRPRKRCSRGRFTW